MDQTSFIKIALRDGFALVAMVAILLLAVATVPQEGAAQSTAVFSRLGFGARGLAMGNALAADASGHTSPYYNAALAPLTERQNLSASAALLRLDRELQFLQFAAPLRPRAGIAVGLVHAGVSKIDGRDGSGFHTRDLSTDEFAFFLAFGLKVADKVSVGVALQLFRSDLLDEIDPVNSVGIDVGAVTTVTDRLRLALVFEDLLAKYNWDSSGAFGAGGKTTRDRFPRRIRLGASYESATGAFRVGVEQEILFATLETRSGFVEVINGVPRESVLSEEITRARASFRAGGEYELQKVFTVRGGLDRLGSDGFAGVAPSLGFAVEQAVGNLIARGAYALVLEPDAVGAMHIITLRLFL